jgi:hypothetical protein
MSIVLEHLLKGCHALLELALRDERARLRPNDRTLATIKKKKLAIKDKLRLFDDRRTSSASH